jgi:uncharacterized protein YcfL
MNLKFRSFALAGALAALTACNPKTINTVGPAAPVGQRQMLDDKRILTDASLNRAVRIVGLNEAVEPGGVLRVQVELQNMTRKPRLFSYRFEWFDARGMQLSSPQSTAISRQIEGRESLFLSGIAPSPDIKDFRLKLQESVR